MSRLDRFPPNELDEEQRDLYAHIALGPRAKGPQLFALTDDQGGLRGPFNAFLLSPAVGHPLQALGSAIRYHSRLTARTRELAILAVAARWDSEFEWSSHERVAQSVGVTEQELQFLKGCEVPPLSDPVEQAALEAVQAMLDGDIPDDIFDTAVAEIGRAGLFELSTLVGYYSTLALQMRVFQVTD
jgi:4-carboxymuconolactone decarboxylase